MQNRTKIVVAVGLVAVALSAPTRAGARPSLLSAERPGNLIAFTRWLPNSRSALFTVRSNGHDVDQLTRGQSVGNFAWGPGGRHLLYSTGHGIWIMRWDGSHRTRLLARAHRGLDGPLWSPDGKKFLFFTAHRPNSSDYKADVYRFADHSITKVGLSTAGYGGAAWSPDGQQIVFSALDDTARHQLWTDSVGTGTVVQLTSFRRGEKGSGAEYPAWSPAGGRIVFVLEATRCQSGCFETNLWSVAPDGSHLHQITFSPRRGEHQAAWAPHGRRFVNASSTDGNYDLPSNYTALVVRRPDGTTIHRIHAHGDELPSWSPNGGWILADRPTWGTTFGDDADKPGLWVMRADGSDAHRILKLGYGSNGSFTGPAAWEPSPR